MVIQPAAEELGFSYIMCLGHSRPDILLKVYGHVLDAWADMAAATLSGHFGGGFSVPVGAPAAD
jgi:hypothetical protein